MAYTNKDRDRFIGILTKQAGNVAGACRAMNINRRTYYNWMEKHEDFKVTVDDITEALIDDAESQLQTLISSGNVVAILFYLKTLTTVSHMKGYYLKRSVTTRMN